MTIDRRSLTALLPRLAVLLATCSLGAALAQTPKTIRLMVGFPPGGGTDAIARILAEKLKDELGASVIVENKPGASGAIGSRDVARSEPDGHTLVLVPGIISH